LLNGKTTHKKTTIESRIHTFEGELLSSGGIPRVAIDKEKAFSDALKDDSCVKTIKEGYSLGGKVCHLLDQTINPEWYEIQTIQSQEYMTVIAAKIIKNEISMSCDSQISRGWHKKSTGYPDKIITGDDFILGVSGSAMVLPLLMVYSKNHKIGVGDEDRIIEWGSEFLDYCKKKTGSWDQSCSMILAHNSGLFMIEDWLPLRIKDFCATGSGYKHAESALYLGESTESAVSVAIALADGCGGEIITKKVTLNKV